MELEPEGSRARTREHWIVLVCALLVPVGLTAMALLFRPDPRGFGTHEQLGLRPCTTMELFGIPCPGCGVTTSVTLASQGHLLDSFLTQPLGLVLALGAVAFSAWSLWGQFRGRDLYVDLLRLPLRKLGGWLVVVALLSWIYKCIVV